MYEVEKSGVEMSSKKNFSTPDFSTPDLSTLDFSTMNFPTPYFSTPDLGLKSPGLRNLGLKSSRLKSLGLKSSFLLWGWKVHGWKVQGWKVWGWSLGLKSPGLKCPSTEVITSSRGITLFSWLSSSWFEVTDKDHYLTCFCRFLHSNIFFKLTSKLFKNSAQVNLCQKLSFLHLLTLHVTTDCSLNHKKSPRSEHFQNFKTVE